MKSDPVSHPGRRRTAAASLAAVAAVAAGISWWQSDGRTRDVEAEDPGAIVGQLRAQGLPGPPAGAHVVLPPDAIRAVDRPEFVPAPRARVTDDSPMVLVRGKHETRAYSLRLLNQHEIVNDILEDDPIAVTW